MECAIRAASVGNLVGGVEHARSALRRLADQPEDGRRLVLTLTRLGSLELRSRQIEAARVTIERLKTLEERGLLPLVSHAGSDLHEMLGELAVADGRPAVAESHYRAAVRIEERIGGPQTPTLLNALLELARLLRNREHLSAAREQYERLLKLEFSDPDVAAAHRRDILLELASLLLQSGLTEEARPLIAEARALAEGVAPDPRARFSAALGESELLFRSGHLQEAEEEARDLLGRERERGVSPALLTPLEQLARILTRQGRFEEASTVRGEMLDLGARFFGTNSPQQAQQLEELADLSVRREDPEAAIPSLERAVRVVWTTNGPLDWRLPGLLHKQAVLVEQKGCELQAADYRRTADRIGGRLNQRGREN